MWRSTTILLSGILPLMVCAQQLVPNPSFESVSTCPTFASMLGNAAPWFNPTAGTPELYHGCAGSGTFAGVPMNYSGGFQYARTGQAFAGIYTYRTGIAQMREYISVPLLAPMEAGRCYAFTMFVNMPDDFELACDAVGVHFSNGPIGSNTPTILPLEAHIEHSAGLIITDTVGWTEVSGTYTATGGEDHLTIGNFRPDAQTNVITLNPGVWYTGQAYLLVDDVSLMPLEDLIDLGPDTAICGNGTYMFDASVPGSVGVLWNDGSTSAVRAITTSGVYAVEVDMGGCILRDTVSVELRPLPFLDLGPDQTLCGGSIHSLIASIDAESELLWDDGSNGTMRTIEIGGTYSATATNACGEVRDEVTVIFEDCPDGIYLPNAFTPDGDGINDLFLPVYDERVWRISYWIFDRWGQEIFRSEGDPWQPADIPSGIYMVRLQAGSILDRSKHRRILGHVALIR